MKTEEERTSARVARLDKIKANHQAMMAKAKVRADARPKAKPREQKPRVPDHATVVIQG
jgi:hypothetical protein